MSTYHYDGSPCPESCACVNREIERFRAELKRLRRIERAMKQVRRHIEVMGNGEQSDPVRVHNRLLSQSEDALKILIAALKKGGRK